MITDLALMKIIKIFPASVVRQIAVVIQSEKDLDGGLTRTSLGSKDLLSKKN